MLPGCTMDKKLIFLFDVDNTLLDNDRVTADLKRQLEREVGHERQERYWAIFEELRDDGGQVAYSDCDQKSVERTGYYHLRATGSLRVGREGHQRVPAC